MWIYFVNAAYTVWAWLPAITSAAERISAIIGLVIAVRRAIRWWRTLR